MDKLLIFLPIILGAIIGYVTNAIAIRMLFRPYTEKRIFGIKVPFTPGIIPKKRKEFAKGIGNLVSKELLTEGAFKDHLQTPEFENYLKQIIAMKIDEFLGQNNPIKLGEESRAHALSLLKSAGISFLQSKYFANLLEDSLNFVFESLDATKIKNIFGENKIISPSDLTDFFIQVVKGRESRNFSNFKLKLSKQIEKYRQQNSSLESILSLNSRGVNDHINYFKEVFGKEEFELLSKSLEFLYFLFEKLIFILGKEEYFKRELVKQTQGMIEGIVEKFDFMQKVIIGMGSYDKKIKEKVPEIIDDIYSSLKISLRRDETKTAFLSVALKYIKKTLQTGFVDVEREYSVNLEKLSFDFLDKVSDLVEKQKFKKRVRVFFLNVIRGGREMGILALFSKLTGLEKEKMLVVSKNIVKDYVANEKNVNALVNKIEEVLLSIFSKTQGNPLGFLYFKKNDITVSLNKIVIDMLRTNIGEIVQSFQIYDLVVKKIDNLEVKEVEGLIMVVIMNQLNWINIFGAILGGLIGALQTGMEFFRVYFGF